MKKHFFKNFAFEFEITRLMWYAPFGGADYGEVATVAEKIQDGNYESWYVQWQKIAEKLQQRGQKLEENRLQELAAAAYFRGSRYYQAAEFFLPPSDSRKREAYQNSVDLFYQGLDLKKITFVRNVIEYDNLKLRTVYFPTQQAAKGTIFICGGFDALLEELYFTNVQAATQSGYDVVLYEGPGQSAVIRNYQQPFEADWHLAVKAVVSYYEKERGPLKNKIGIGLSLGGLLLARTASFESQLFDKVILYNYFPSMQESFKFALPKFLHPYLKKGFPARLENISSWYIRHHKFLNWQVEHAKWVFGATSLNNLLKKTAAFSEELAYSNLTADCLIFLAEKENYYDYRLGLNFFEKIPASRKKLVCFNKEKFSSELHCQNGAAYESQEVLFSWLAELETEIDIA
ncbi:serine aminopeptidase domain-containing protein [Enterococcus sp. HY326]|uniref:serine aminopeptidase domain-containing protein n=1 Tax=Enterococcus sp. HY326 TaxID=2971265 RepID=UPI0022405148|nr:alpha/beta hydrolase [Enterococcus sp. HY326]